MNQLFKVSLMLITVISIAMVGIAQFAPSVAQPFPFSVIQPTGDCQLPCWHSLRPGVTTRAEAEANLAHDPTFAQLYSAPRLLTAQVATSTDSDSLVSVYFDKTGRVSVISFSLMAAPGDILAKLADLTARMGDSACTARLALYFPAIEADSTSDAATLNFARPHSLSTPIRLTLLLSAPTIDPIMALQASARLGLLRANLINRGAAVCGF